MRCGICKGELTISSGCNNVGGEYNGKMICQNCQADNNEKRVLRIKYESQKKQAIALKQRALRLKNMSPVATHVAETLKDAPKKGGRGWGTPYKVLFNKFNKGELIQSVDMNGEPKFDENEKPIMEMAYWYHDEEIAQMTGASVRSVSNRLIKFIEPVQLYLKPANEEDEPIEYLRPALLSRRLAAQRDAEGKKHFVYTFINRDPKRSDEHINDPDVLKQHFELLSAETIKVEDDDADADADAETEVEVEVEEPKKKSGGKRGNKRR